MKSKARLTLLACALAAASGAGAQPSGEPATNIPPPNDIIRLPRSVTTPDMPIIVEPPRDDIGRKTLTAPASGTSLQSPPLIRSLGSGSDAPADTGMSGSVSGTGATTNGGAAVGVAAPSATHSVNGASSSGGSGGPTDIGGVNGARSSAGLNGGITPSSGGVGAIFDSGSNPSDNAGAAATDAGGPSANTNAGNGDANTNTPSGSNATPGVSITVPAGRTGIPRTNAQMSRGSAGGGTGGK